MQNATASGTAFAARPNMSRPLYEHLVPKMGWRQLARELWKESKTDHLTNGAAALAFYLVLALFPAAIFGLSVLPYLPIPNLEQTVMEVVRDVMPGAAADTFTDNVRAVLSSRSGGLLSFGFLFTIWSASNGLYAVMDQLNVVYGVEEKRSFFRTRGVALLLMLLFTLLVVGGLGLIVFGGTLESFIASHVDGGVVTAIFAVVRWVIILAGLLLAFALVYYLGPNVDQPFVLITPGSVFATIGLLVASFAFKLYVANLGSYDKVYGSIGAVIVLLMWLYITGLVILLGAEINDIVQRHAEAPREPKEGGPAAEIEPQPHPAT